MVKKPVAVITEKKPGKKVKGEDSFLTELIEVSGNEYADIADNGIESGDINSFIDTGAYALNGMLCGNIYGGTPDNKIAALAGEESTGKSFFVLSMIQTFLETRSKGIVVLFESEGGLTKKMLTERGMDPKRIAVFPAETVETTNTQAVKMLDHYLTKSETYRKDNPMIMVLDSLGMLSTEKETADTASGSEKKDMTRAALVKKMFRTLTLKLSRAGVAFLVTNHTYDETGPFGKRVMGGGSGLKYSASITIFLSKAQYKEGDDRTGNILTATLKKGRLTKEGSQVKLLLRYDTGLDRYYGLLPIALEYGIFKESGKKIMLSDGITEVKESAINKNPATYFTPDVLAIINDAVADKFKFGSAQDLLEVEVDD